MYPVAHITVAVAATCGGERFVRREGPSRLDLRFAAFGALLPDLIDKPLAWVLFPGTFSESHLYGHTLLFALSLIATGALLARRGEWRLFAIGVGALTHLLIDPVIAYPHTFFWPLLGTGFADSGVHLGFYQRIVDATLLAAGGLLWTVSPAAREAVRRFVAGGRVSWPRRLTAGS